MNDVSSSDILRLPRGGYVVDTPEGRIQFAAPPETIKDTLVTEQSVPQVFVLPQRLFHWQKGINVADMEFPIYFNFFLKKRKVTVLCTPDQRDQLTRAMQEAVFGPKNLDLSGDAYDAGDDVYVPDIRGELAFFRGSLKLADLFECHCFKNNSITYGSVTIRINDAGDYEVSSKGNRIATVPGRVEYKSKYDIGERLSEPYIPPRFGVTCLGPSHGFDPKDNTSGFIIWLNHAGIMVDPPVNSTEWLERSNVNPKYIDSIILTHCHADHDAGTFQKILEEGRISIYTTPTILDSFLRKYAAFSGESVSYLKKLFTFHPVYMGRSFFLHGGEFQGFYSLHSIPTMGFRLRFQDASFIYSSDHQADPEIHQKLLDDGLISQRRYDQLQTFPWESDVIYHEAGIPPLHTPVSFLNSLPTEVQRKIFVYHIARKDFPEDTELTLASFGIENTRYFDTEPPEYEQAYQVLEVLKHLEFFETLEVGKVQEFMSIVERQNYKAGEKIIEEGSRGRHFFILSSGNALVSTSNLVREKRLGAFEYFGEVALLTSSTRTADIIAETDVEAFVIEKSRFLNFIAGTEFEDVLQRLIRNRSEETWNILVKGEVFRILTDYQRMWIESLLVAWDFKRNGTLISEGRFQDGIYVIREGEVQVYRGMRQKATLGPGDIAGSLDLIFRNDPAEHSFKYKGGLKTFFIAKDDVLAFLRRNPGVAKRLTYQF